MRTFGLLLLGACQAIFAQAPGSDCYACMPSGFTTDMTVETLTRSTGTGLVKERVTIADKLKQLRARCRRAVLVDARGRAIRFFSRVGCWGTPPPDYRQILAKQTADLKRLKKKYTVVEIPCNPDPLIPPMVVRPTPSPELIKKPPPGGDNEKTALDPLWHQP